MDCIDCHNRPTHTYELPERALDGAMAKVWYRNRFPPFIKRLSKY